MGNWAKGNAVAANVSIGLKVNATQVRANTTIGTGAAALDQGFFLFLVWQQTTSYLAGGWFVATAASGLNDRSLCFDTNAPNATITSITVTGVTGDAGLSFGVRDVVVYRLLTT